MLKSYTKTNLQLQISFTKLSKLVFNFIFQFTFTQKYSKIISSQTKLHYIVSKIFYLAHDKLIFTDFNLKSWKYNNICVHSVSLLY